MMNKATKILLSLTLVIQLLIPGYLLFHHYSLINTAMETEAQYRFRLSSLSFSYPAGKDTAEAVEAVFFEIENLFYLYDKKITVSVDDNGIALTKEADDTAGACWFHYDYYIKNSEIYKNNFTFEPDVNVRDLINEVRKEYSWFNRNDENRIYAYVTAKIHKGIFIPTAIYFGDTKIITITSE